MVETTERQFGNFSMVNIEARGNHVNGVNSDGELVYRGDSIST